MLDVSSISGPLPSPNGYDYASVEYANNMNKSFFLDCLSMNVQSFKANYMRIINLIDSLNQPSIICMSEIWNPPVDILNIHNYHPPIFKKRKSRRGGGVALHVKNSLKILKVHDLSNLELRCIETVAVTVQSNMRSFIFVSVYRAPNKKIITTLEEIESIFEYFSTFSHPVYIQGDTNINFQNNDKMTKRYKELLETFALNQLVCIPTRVTAKSKSILDHVISNNKIDAKVIVLEDNISDHQPIYYACYAKDTFDEKFVRSEITPVYLNYNKTKKALENFDWKKLELDISILDANSATDIFIKSVQSCMKYESRLKRANAPIKPWMSNDLLKMRKKQLEKRRLFLKNPTEIREASYKQALKSYKKALRKSRSNYYHEKIFKADCNSKKVWQVINEAMNRKQKVESGKIQLIKDGQLITNDYEVASCFNDFYINFGPELAKTVPKADVPVDQLLKTISKPNDQFSFRDMSCAEITEIISSLKPKTSSSADKIPNKLILEIKAYIANIFTYIINKSFKEGKFPTVLKIAKLIPLFKADSPEICSNYRPISSLSPASKITEKAALKQINEYTSQNKIIPKLQFGFRSKHSTIHALMAVNEFIQKELNKNKHVFLCGIDLRKAFDLIQTVTILPIKLRHLNFDENSINWITSFFSERKQFVHVNNVDSSTENLHDISLCQGSSMGPPFFSLYIFDLPQHTNFTTYLFADDTTFLLSHRSLDVLIKKANTELKKVQNYMQAHQMFLNLKKTVYTLYHPKNAKIKKIPLEVKVDEYPITMVQDFKFLGVNLQSNQKYDIQYDAVIAKMNKGIAALSFVKFDLPTRTKILIYHALVKSAYEYATPIWSLNLNLGEINYIIRLQKRALRAVYRIKRMCHSIILFKKSGVIRFDFLFLKYTMELVFKFFTRELPEKILELLNHFEFPRKLRNSEMYHFNIPEYYKKDDLYYEIMTTWNKIPSYMKESIHEEALKEKPSFQIVKSLTKKYIESLYPECNKKPCVLCVRSRLLMATNLR